MQMRPVELLQPHWKPVSFGLLTTDTIEQAIERSGAKAGNQGRDATDCAIEMARLLKQISEA